MNYSFLGKTGLSVSQLAMGTMSFGGDATEEEAKQMFAACRDAGINFFDCADVYNKGEAERILGRLLKSCRNEVIVATKGYFPVGDSPNDRGSTRYHLTRAVEDSLKRLNTDRIDIYFLHRFDDATPLEETLGTLERLIQQGKILYIGVSNFAAWQTAKAMGVTTHNGYAPIVCTQPMYNLVKRQAEVEILPMAKAESLGVLTYSPLAGGLLTGKYGSHLRPPSGRLIDNPMYQMRYGNPDDYAAAEAFNQIAEECGIHPVSLAIAWVASHPAITAPLIGGRHLDQLRPALDAVNVVMDEELRTRISNLTPTPPPATDRNEETSAHNYGSR
jgi:aryl-alcohol dehydrogenase-like predicted oxidoreductase